MSGGASGAASGGARDPGLQPERTSLAWVRTGLAVVAGSLVGGRLLAPHTGGAGLALGAAGTALGLLLVGASRLPRRSGALLAAVAAGCVLLGVAGFVVVLVTVLVTAAER